MDTALKCANCGISFVNRQRRRKHYLKCQPVLQAVVNSESDAEDKVIQDLVHYIEYIMLLGNYKCIYRKYIMLLSNTVYRDVDWSEKSGFGPNSDQVMIWSYFGPNN